MISLIERLFPITRSITGDGVRETLSIINEHIPLVVHEVPSGTSVLDWTVPPEWNVGEAWIRDSSGRTVVDLVNSNLHLVSYSIPVHTNLPLDELQQHLHSLPDRPDLIPYRTSYSTETWGFCLSHRLRETLADGEYEVFIGSTLEPGSLTYAEHVVAGDSTGEIIVSSHVCHPSLANDNLSGVAVAVALAQRLASNTRGRLTTRFVFAPGTIGTITWLERNRDQIGRIQAGFTLVSLADGAPLTYKRTFDGRSVIDRAAALVLEESDVSHRFLDFYPYGYDERHYNSPGFRLPVGSFMRSVHGQTPEYHTSGDNLDLVDPAQLEEALDVLTRVIEVVDRNLTYVNQAPYGEPQLGKRGLYEAIGGKNIADLQLAMLWVLNLSDGEHDLLAIAERSDLPFDTVAEAADLLAETGLVQESVP